MASVVSSIGHDWRGGKLKSNPKQLFKGAAVELEDLSYDDSIRWKYAYFFETDLARYNRSGRNGGFPSDS